MANVTENVYKGNGSQTLFSFSFPYINQNDVKVSLDGVDQTEYTFANATTVELATPPADQVTVRVYRETDDSSLIAEFFAGSAIRAQDLNGDFEQLLYISQETRTFAANTDAGAIADTANTALTTAQQAVTTATAAENTANAISDVANSAIQPGDNVSELVNDIGYALTADLVNYGVSTFNTRSGDVTLQDTDVWPVIESGGTFTGEVEFDTIDVGGINITGTGTGTYTLPPAAPTEDAYLESSSAGDLRWQLKTDLLDDTAVVKFSNIFENKATVDGIECPSYLTYGRGFTHSMFTEGRSEGFAYINKKGNLYYWGTDSEYFRGTGYNAGQGSWGKKKIAIDYQDYYNRRAWMGDPDYAHLRTNIEGEPIEKFEDMGKVRQSELGFEGHAVLTENGRIYTCGYSGYGSPGQETTTASTMHLKPIRLWTAAGGALLDGPNFPKVKQIHRNDAGKGYDYNTYSALYALDTDGYVYSCGYNGLGQLGTNNTTYYTYLQRLDPLAFDNEKVVIIGGDSSYYCTMWAITESGKCFVWGSTTYSCYNYSNDAFNVPSTSAPSDMTANPINSLYGKKVVHVVNAGDDNHKQRWFICSDGTVHWQGAQRSVSYRTSGLMGQDMQYWIDTDPTKDGLAVRSTAYGSTTHPAPTGAYQIPWTQQLDSAGERINSNGQKVVAGWCNGDSYSNAYFLTDGGNDGPDARKLYTTETYATGPYYSTSTTHPDGRMDEDYNIGYASEPNSRAVKEMNYGWLHDIYPYQDGNALDNRWARRGTDLQKENIEVGAPVVIMPNSYYTNVQASLYMIDDKGYVWFTGYDGANYGPHGFYNGYAASGAPYTYVYNWQRIYNLPENMKYIFRMDNMATLSNYYVGVGCDYEGNLWGGHAKNTVPNNFFSPVGLVNTSATAAVQTANGEHPYSIVNKF